VREHINVISISLVISIAKIVKFMDEILISFLELSKILNLDYHVMS
jgi:hypothetical protein